MASEKVVGIATILLIVVFLVLRVSLIDYSRENIGHGPGQGLMILTGNGGNADPAVGWEEWIKAYKGWDNAQWDEFYEGWENAETAAEKDAYLEQYQIRIFSWGGDTLAARKAGAAQLPIQKAIPLLNAELEGLGGGDFTILGLSKGGNLAVNYLWAIAREDITPTATPTLVILLSPGVSWVTRLVNPEIPWTLLVPKTDAYVVNVCPKIDPACTNILVGADVNINPEYDAGFFEQDKYHHSHQQLAVEILGGFKAQDQE